MDKKPHMFEVIKFIHKYHYTCKIMLFFDVVWLNLFVFCIIFWSEPNEHASKSNIKYLNVQMENVSDYLTGHLDYYLL